MPEEASVLARRIYTDTLVPMMGNKFAYTDFLTRHMDKGIHVHVDLNDFGEFNKVHGDLVGDEILAAFGAMASRLSRLYRGKAFRFGGDEFKFHFESFKVARKFVADLVKSLSGACLRDLHVTASIGIGNGRDRAERALMVAKARKKENGGQTSYVSSEISFD